MIAFAAHACLQDWMVTMRPSEVERLYTLFGHRVYSRCFYLLKEDQAAMDVTQDTFLALVDRFRTWSAGLHAGLSPFSAFPDDRRACSWLLTVATNKSFNELRRRRYWKSVPAEEAEASPLQSHPFPFVLDRMLVQELLEPLKPEKASLVIGYFLEGRTLEEVARENDVSVPTVRRAVSDFLGKARARTGERSTS